MTLNQIAMILELEKAYPILSESDEELVDYYMELDASDELDSDDESMLVATHAQYCI